MYTRVRITSSRRPPRDWSAPAILSTAKCACASGSFPPISRDRCKRATGRTVYILDEPTTGLHFADIQRLLDVLNRLVEAGNTVIVIEHNLDVIKNADWILDLGPEGGDRGGEIVAEGTPQAVARVTRSYTGQVLREAGV